MRQVLSTCLMITLASFLLSSCQPTHKEKVKNAVKNHLSEKAGKDQTYKSKSFGSLDSAYMDLKATDKYNMLSDTIKLSAKVDAMEMEIDIRKDADSLEEEYQKIRKNLKQRREMLNEYVKEYEPRLKGYLIPHTYQWGDGQKTKQFEVDTAYKVVEAKAMDKES